MKLTPIQWCDSTINPAPGCDGCELWPTPNVVKAKLVEALITMIADAGNKIRLQQLVAEVLGDRDLSDIYLGRKAIAAELASKLGLDRKAIAVLVDVVRKAAKCYAGLLGTFRAGHKGYADAFIRPKLFPGRMAAAAKWKSPTDADRESKPWLTCAPRMIFVSDMGDALSRSVSFSYLKQEIIDIVSSEAGSKHLWLWLTKRPSRMADFGRWLMKQGIQWPDNLVAMTTVTSQATAGRVNELRKVPAKFKGLSIEPLFTELHLDLTSIDWVIVGGGSDVLAEPFHVEWALSLRDQCRKAGTAFFLKQLGKNPMYKGQPLQLEDRHGGEWAEWSEAWRTREIPDGFRRNV